MRQLMASWRAGSRCEPALSNATAESSEECTGGVAAQADSVSLTTLPTGSPAVLLDIHADPAVTRRLGELGLRRGMRLTALQRTCGGGRVVAAGELRLALDRTMVDALQVGAPAGSPS